MQLFWPRDKGAKEPASTACLRGGYRPGAETAAAHAAATHAAEAHDLAAIQATQAAEAHDVSAIPAVQGQAPAAA